MKVKQTNKQPAMEDPIFQSKRKGRGYTVRKYSLNRALLANRCATWVKNVEVLFFPFTIKTFIVIPSDTEMPLSVVQRMLRRNMLFILL